jgi:predicted DNA-binding transcriptional regulator YafY
VNGMAEKKSRILYVQRFLERQTDEAHPVTLTDIIAYLAGEGIAATRKTILLDIEQLTEAGTDVVCNRSRQNTYFIGDRHFELPELKLLIDAAQASKFLNAKRSRSLIDKLLALVSSHQRADLTRGLYFDDHVKPRNERAYIAVDKLHTAISAGKRVRFMYYDYNPDKKKIYKHNRREYEFSPWKFVWDSDKYYVLGYSESHSKAVAFRVDRIAAPELTGLDAVPMTSGFDLAAFVKATFSMYGGPMLDVTLKCENALMNSIIDRFGEDVRTEIADPEHFYATVSIAAGKTFYGWVFTSEGAINITAPAEAVEAYRAMLNKVQSIASGASENRIGL